MTEQASELMRRENRRAVQRRAEWRAKYRLVTQAIRAQREQIKQSHAADGGSDALAQVTLRSLQLTARLMMLDRDDIAWDLRDTAYRWVDVEAA